MSEEVYNTFLVSVILCYFFTFFNYKKYLLVEDVDMLTSSNILLMSKQAMKDAHVKILVLHLHAIFLL